MQNKQYWVDEFRKTYPYMVQVDMAGSYVRERMNMYDWLTEHVGRRGVLWEFPTDRTYMFKQEEHAVLFSMTWGE